MVEIRNWGEVCVDEESMPWAECMNSGEEAIWIWDELMCFEDKNAMENAMAKDCVEVKGGEWVSLQEGWENVCYIKGEDAYRDCKMSAKEGEIKEYHWIT